MTHSEKVLQLLSDGQPHSYREGYALNVMLHSRVSDLRRQGHSIRCWRDGDDYLYQLTVRAGNEATADGLAALSCPSQHGPSTRHSGPPEPDVADTAPGFDPASQTPESAEVGSPDAPHTSSLPFGCEGHQLTVFEVAA